METSGSLRSSLTSIPPRSKPPANYASVITKWLVQACLGSGGVTFDRAAKLRRLTDQLPLWLAELERAGLIFEWHADYKELVAIDSPIVAQLTEAGAIALVSRSVSTGEQVAIRLSVEGTEGYEEDGWHRFLDAVATMTWSPQFDDCRAKLSATATSERHLFIGTSYTSPWAINCWLSSDRSAVPDQVPDLPEEISHLWLWGPLFSGRVLAWFPDRGWFDPRMNWATS